MVERRLRWLPVYSGLLLCILAVSSIGCSPKATIGALPESKVVANEFLDGFPAKPQEEVDSFFVDEFWEAMPRETWSKIVPNLLVELGPIETCNLANWSQSTSASTSGSGNFVSLSYSCKHTKYDSVITLNLVTPLAGGATKIQGFNISSIGLLIE